MDKRALSSKQVEWAYARYCEGYTLIQIADALNVCDMTVRRALKGRPRIRPILKYNESNEEA